MYCHNIDQSASLLDQSMQMHFVFECSSWLDAQNHSGVARNGMGMFSATTA